jgi:hypothetical protein
MAESREEMIERWEEMGILDPNCAICQEDFYSSPRKPVDVMAPRHRASFMCESGWNHHCTCDRCF